MGKRRRPTTTKTELQKRPEERSTRAGIWVLVRDGAAEVSRHHPESSRTGGIRAERNPAPGGRFYSETFARERARWLHPRRWFHGNLHAEDAGVPAAERL